MGREIPPSLRARIAQPARQRCEYCLISSTDAGFPHEIDHVISRKHGGLTVDGNLAYCCVLCNRFKGTDVATIAQEAGSLVRLFHPRLDIWPEHFQIRGAELFALTPIAEATIRILRLNSTERVLERGLLQELGRYPTGGERIEEGR